MAMHLFWQPAIERLFNAARPSHAIEIGCDEGRTTRHLVRWCRVNGARLDLIDPAPAVDIAAMAERAPGLAYFHRDLSLNVLPTLPAADIVLIDGDHNWYTVYNEITVLWQRAEAEGRLPPILVCHDTEWPYARRDLYYNPDTIPDEYRHPARRGGLMPAERGLAAGGINDSLVNAETEGGPRNGVRTAIEDALATRPDDMRVVWLPVLFGLGLIVPRARLAQSPTLTAFVDSLEPSRPWRQLGQLMESRRIADAIETIPLRAMTVRQASIATERSALSSLPTEALRNMLRGMSRYRYRDREMLLNPLDMANYLAVLGDMKPGTVFELGVYRGGRTVWIADMLTAVGVEANVVGVDSMPPDDLSDPRIRLFAGNVRELGNTLTPEFLSALPRPFLVIEDSAHDADTTEAALNFFDPYLQSGDRFVVEDGIVAQLELGERAEPEPHGAALGAARFLARRGDDYRVEAEICDRFGYNATFNPNGWLVRL